MKHLRIKCKTLEEKIAAASLCGAYGYTYSGGTINDLIKLKDKDLLNMDYPHVVIYGNHVNSITFVTETWTASFDSVEWSDGLSKIIERLAVRRETFKISKDYDATVTKDGIEVGCQKISFADFNKLAAIVKTFQ